MLVNILTFSHIENAGLECINKKISFKLNSESHYIKEGMKTIDWISYSMITSILNFEV